MNIISEAIYQKKHMVEIEGVHTWRAFDKVQHKKLYLFGATVSSRYFLEKYGRKYFVHGILDNSKEKQNTWFYQQVFVTTPEVLKNDDLDNIVVLITGTNYYAEIYKQLQELGVKSCFVLCKMEAERLGVRLQVTCKELNNKYGVNTIEKRVFYHFGWNRYIFKCVKWLKQCHKYPTQSNKIVLFSGEECKDHPKYISQALLETKKNLDIVWILKDETLCPEGTRCVWISNTRQMIYELATAKVWINADVFPIYVRKRKGQIYIQTKHWSSITLKKFYFDTPVHYKTRPWIKYLWKNDAKMIDYIVTGSEFDRRTCEAGFRYCGKFMDVGSPRTDILFQKEACKKKVFGEYQLPDDVNLILYAPTFRVGESKGAYAPQICEVTPDFEMLVQSVATVFGGKWKVALRLHPAVASQSKELLVGESIVDMCNYEDIQELLATADVIITDYSSLMFEPAMVGKKVFLFTPDLEEYCVKERDLWFDIKELPFSYAINEEELYENIQNHDEECYQKKVKAFFEYHGVCEDGHASERAVEFILKQMEQ